MTDASSSIDSGGTRRGIRSGSRLDVPGHASNAVDLNRAEQVAIDHVEAMGYGPDWSTTRGGGVGGSRAPHHLPPSGDVRRCRPRDDAPQEIGGVGGRRRTEIHHERDGALLTEVETVWIWIRTADARPTRISAELLAHFGR